MSLLTSSTSSSPSLQKPSYGLNGINKHWFYGFLSASEAEQALHKQPIGTFLIRFSKSRLGSFALAFVNKDGKVAHVLIVGDATTGFTMKESGNTNPKTFDALQELVNYYSYILIFPLHSQMPFNNSWFHGDLTSKEATTALATEKKGTFLVRLSRKGAGYYAVSYVDDGVKHSLIESVCGGGFHFQGESVVLPTLEALVASHNHILRFPYRVPNEKRQKEVEALVDSFLTLKGNTAKGLKEVEISEEVKQTVAKLLNSGSFNDEYDDPRLASLGLASSSLPTRNSDPSNSTSSTGLSLSADTAQARCSSPATTSWRSNSKKAWSSDTQVGGGEGSPGFGAGGERKERKKHTFIGGSRIQSGNVGGNSDPRSLVSSLPSKSRKTSSSPGSSSSPSPPLRSSSPSTRTPPSCSSPAPPLSRASPLSKSHGNLTRKRPPPPPKKVRRPVLPATSPPIRKVGAGSGPVSPKSATPPPRGLRLSGSRSPTRPIKCRPSRKPSREDDPSSPTSPNGAAVSSSPSPSSSPSSSSDSEGEVTVKLVDNTDNTIVKASKNVKLDQAGRIPLQELMNTWKLKNPISWVDLKLELGVMRDGYSDCTFNHVKVIRIVQGE